MKTNSRASKAKKSVVASLISQFITLACGLVVPHKLLGAFGSAAYGATASIASFLAYITLLEGGIAAVSRSALYKALADVDYHNVSRIITETKQFFQKLAFIFAGYVLLLACFFDKISNKSSLGFWTSFSLVIVIAISTFAEYFIGISYSVLFQADQRTYIPTAFKITTTILNTCMVVLLVNCHCSLIVVKLASSLVYILKPIALSVLAKRQYPINPCVEEEKLLTQKKTAFGQHIAWVIHNNTDIGILTIFGSLSLVSVYCIYNMVIGQIVNITSAFTSGMEALFGDMYAKREIEELNQTFNYYETLISIIAVTIFSATMVLIVPFVALYTAKIKDTNYIEPTFAILLSVATLMTCLRLPYGNIIIAAGHFKQTRMAAYGEALINIVLSIALVFRFGLIGVVIGTVAAILFRWIFYADYLSENILHRPFWAWGKRLLCNSAVAFIIFLAGNAIVGSVSIETYFDWLWCAVTVTALSFSVVIVTNLLLFRADTVAIFKQIIPHKTAAENQ